MSTKAFGEGQGSTTSASKQEKGNRFQQLLILFSAILAVRLVSMAIIHVVGFDPFGGGQANVHARTAEAIASNGFAFEFDIWQISHRWGLLLAPFWWLPGPSILYAQFAVAVIGSLGILNVYLICEHYHSKQAGYIALLVLALLPTYSFMHAVLQREALLLFGVTTAFVLTFLPNRHLARPWNCVLALGFVSLAGYQRIFNVPIIVVVVTAITLFAFFRSDTVPVRAKLSGFLATTTIGAGLLFVVIQWIVDIRRIPEFFSSIRARRARGRAIYLEDAIPESYLELLAFSWIGAIYFLFAPFPWQIEAVADLAGVFESLVGIGFLLFSLQGARIVAKKAPLAAFTLIFSLVVVSVLYGFGTANYGTAMRHRQAVFWILIVLGSIGLSSKVRFTIGEKSP